jgi:hypothetical protein
MSCGLPNPLVQRMRDWRCTLQFARQWSRTADHRRYPPEIMTASTIEIALFAWATLAVAAFGLLSGKAVLGGDRKKEPVGFWLTVAIQTFMGVFALLYAVFR